MENRIGAFFIHGFMGYPTDFGNIPSKLEKLNVDTKLIILPGHGEDENVALYSWKNWLSYAEKSYLDYKAKFDVVFLIGFSMGGTIATYLASKYGCDKLVLIAPAYLYLNPIQHVKDIKLAIHKRIFKVNEIKNMIVEKYGYRDVTKKIKIKTYLDFISITKYCIRNSGCLNMPARLFHGDKDEIVPIKSSMNALKRFTNNDIKLHVIPYGSHMLLLGPKGNEVASMVAEFLNTVPVKEESTVS